jgi:hypothetical protein
MRWICIILAVSVVGASPWLFTGVAQAQAFQLSDPSIAPNPAIQIPVVRAGMSEVRALDLTESRTDRVPEPSVAAALSLLGTAFLIRRRRPQVA